MPLFTYCMQLHQQYLIAKSAYMRSKSESHCSNQPSTINHQSWINIEASTQQRLLEFNTGIKLLQSQYYSVPSRSHKKIWSLSVASLYEYAVSAEDYVILCVPSIINKSHIFDLSPSRSMIAFMKAQKKQCYLLHWDSPKTSHLHFSDYILLLEEAITALFAKTKKPILLIGYCLGGILCLAAAHSKQPALMGLCLMAMPWNFHVPEWQKETASQWIHSIIALLQKNISHSSIIKAEIIQSVIYAVYFEQIKKKFTSLYQRRDQPEKIQQFLAIEDWLNDGIDMTASVAMDLAQQFFIENQTHLGAWKHRNQTIIPHQIALPQLHFISQNDRVVPPKSSLSATLQNPYATTIFANTGHTGIATNPAIITENWQYFLNWADQLAAKK